MVAFEVLGPIRANRDGVEIALPAGRLRWLLAVLLLHEGDEVSEQHLLAHVWGPADVTRGALLAAVSRLRVWLGPTGATLTHNGCGYRLTASACSVDASRLRAARTTAALLAGSERLDLLREALTWWRGQPLAGAPEWVRSDRAVDGLLRLRRDLVLDLADLATGLGRPESALDPLNDLCVEAPYDEPAHAAYVRLLAECRRPAQALRQYETIRVRLFEELGVSPGPEVQAAHQAVLALDGVAPTSDRPVPAQLPIDLAVFSGRAEELARLRDLLTDSAESGTPMVATISGPAGVGKSSLAVHCAHQLAARYPDGQLYLNLRGFDPSGSPMSTAEAVGSLLEALGETPEHLPSSIEAQVGLYRSLLAGRRMLVLLDNARDSEQVRALLPGEPGSAAIVTSRHQLVGLIALNGVHALTLDLLSPADARMLMVQRLGLRRVDVDPAALAEVIDRCGRLPLALAIVAAQTAANPTFSLSDLSRQLQAGAGRLDLLTGGDPTSDVRAVFSWSYRVLGREPARLFRLLGGHPGPHVTLADAASLLGVDRRHAQPLLDELARLHLVQQPNRGRYVVHDLLRAFADELLHATDDEPERLAARCRLLDHRLHAGLAAARHLDPHRCLAVAPPLAGVTVPSFADMAEALAWFASERSVMVMAVRWAADHGHDRYAWQIAWTLQSHFEREGHSPVWVEMQRIAVAAADRLGDGLGQSLAYRGLGVAMKWQGDFAAAHECYQRALELGQSIGDKVGESIVEYNLACLLERQGRYREARRHVQRALTLFPSGDDGAPAGALVRMLNVSGWLKALEGEYEAALVDCERALSILPELGTRNDEACIIDSIAYARQHLGDHAGAIAGYRRSIELFRAVGNRSSEAEEWVRLAECYNADGQFDAARQAAHHASAMLAESRHPEFANVRLRLSWAGDP